MTLSLPLSPYPASVSETDQPRATLARVIKDLGDPFLEVVAGDPSSRNELSEIVVHDARHETSLRPGAVVLGVGVYGSEETAALLTSLGQHDAAALIVRSPVDPHPDLLRAVADSGVVLLALTRAADWLQLADVLRTLVLQNDVVDDANSMLGGVAAGDLFAVANAVAALIDAPITIEDRDWRVLAFSGRQHDADAARIQTILDRQVPEVYVREDEGRGVFRALYRTDGPLYVEASKVSSNEIPRVAIAVRAGDEILGSIWAAVHGPLSDERSAALVDAAKLVALHLLRRRAGADVDHRLRADLVATSLEGGPRSAQALSRLGLLGKTVTVMALGILDHDESGSDPSRIAGELQRMADALAMHLSAVAPRSAMALLGDVAYGLVALSGDTAKSELRAKSIATDFLTRTGSRVPAVIGIGPAVADATRLDESRTRADRALRVVRTRGRAGAVATMAEVEIDALVLELQDLALARNDPMSGPLGLIKDYDDRRGGWLVETLEHWLNAFGDIHAAATAAGVHHNTFRYRLKRLKEVGGVDLDSADDRFALMLQLRLMQPRPID